MNTSEKSQSQSYQNVMESLVTAEVARQLQDYPPKLVKYINHIEVETFALNCLPPFYASCTEGWQKQKKRVEAELKDEIVKVVRRAFAAVQRDPIRFSTPIRLKIEKETQEIKEALELLQAVFQPDEPSWRGLAMVAKQVLSRYRVSKAMQKARSYRQTQTEEIPVPNASDGWNQYHQSYRY